MSFLPLSQERRAPVLPPSLVLLDSFISDCFPYSLLVQVALSPCDKITSSTRGGGQLHSSSSVYPLLPTLHCWFSSGHRCLRHISEGLGSHIFSDFVVPSSCFSFYFFPLPLVLSALSYICVHKVATNSAARISCTLW